MTAVTDLNEYRGRLESNKDRAAFEREYTELMDEFKFRLELLTGSEVLRIDVTIDEKEK